MSADDVASALRAALAGRRDVRLALLFGSRATGRARETSDVDLAVAGDVDCLELAAELAQALNHEVDVIALDDVGYPMVRQLVRDAITVHEAVPGSAAAWRSRALATAETDRTWFERMRRSWLRRLAAGRA